MGKKNKNRDRKPAPVVQQQGTSNVSAAIGLSVVVPQGASGAGDTASGLASSAAVTGAQEELRMVEDLAATITASHADESQASDLAKLSSRDITSLKDLTSRLNAARTAFERERELFRKLKDQENRLADQERKLRERELNAEHGFAEQNRAAVARLDQDIAAARTELEGMRAAVKTERAEWDAQRLGALTDAEQESARLLEQARHDAEKLRKEAEEVERVRVASLTDHEAKLTERERELRRQRTELETQRLLFDDDVEMFERRVERVAGARVSVLESELAARITERDTARLDRDQLKELLRLRAEADAKFGSRSPEDLLEHLKGLESDIADLQRQLRQRPSEAVVVRNQQLESEREANDNELTTLRISNAQMESSLARNLVAVTQVEALRDEKEALAKANELLRAALEELKAKVDLYVERADSQTVFPALTAMDNDERYQQAPPALMTTFTDLEKFAGGIRHRIAQDPLRPLYYSERDVRGLLGGFAMSRLHILQGISGTGKTSLPLAFARAVGAGTQLVEVQAGWRDRQDLVGHYNAFERRYYESEFLQALYRAQTPAFADRVFVIVLDEMNLSRPEQYFADFLSALEQSPELRRVTLLPAAATQAPRLLLDGRMLRIPENVWFVGTANHDETTAEFADKTYDRAHVMELPNRPEAFDPKERPERKPVSVTEMQRMFQDMQEHYASEADRVVNLLNAVLAEPMARKFGIAWANRLERQVRAYVPVVVAAGGTACEAADDLVSMKIFRKLRHRHDTKWSDIKAIRDDFLKGWETVLRRDVVPDRSLALLEAEMHRLRGAEALLGQA